jgi:hypothetical protein
MLAMYFVHDGGETAKWRLKGHAIKLFYQFIVDLLSFFSFPQFGYKVTEITVFVSFFNQFLTVRHFYLILI